MAQYQRMGSHVVGTEDAVIKKIIFFNLWVPFKAPPSHIFHPHTNCHLTPSTQNKEPPIVIIERALLWRVKVGE